CDTFAARNDDLARMSRAVERPDLPTGKLFLGGQIILGFVGAFVPYHHRTRAIVLHGNHTFKVRVFQWMILSHGRKAFAGWSMLGPLGTAQDTSTPWISNRKSCFATLSHGLFLPHNLLRTLIGPQPEKARLPELPGACPLGKADLGYEL